MSSGTKIVSFVSFSHMAQICALRMSPDLDSISQEITPDPDKDMHKPKESNIWNNGRREGVKTNPTQPTVREAIITSRSVASGWRYSRPFRTMLDLSKALSLVAEKERDYEKWGIASEVRKEWPNQWAVSS
ncbi:hypothetical protein AX15_003621 [Amanita polypyramis BW_CC]|nr:hypothetical protein AX15_003621 [Amanita polypyramis BW_CC]